ncbi:hypothetical protein FB570_113189 [Streptomyces sp. T12]|nr:hypothetical protein FB570_113189 [Streptomyces sp. T12]
MPGTEVPGTARGATLNEIEPLGDIRKVENMASNVSGTRGHGTGWEARNPWATSWTAAAAVLMVFGGIMAIFEGIAAIAQDDVFVATRNFTYEFSLTGWGWVHLILGALVAAAGMALFTGAAWARVVGVTLAGLSMIANFVWLPYQPVWSIVLIVIDGFIIWALCAPRRESQA